MNYEITQRPYSEEELSRFKENNEPITGVIEFDIADLFLGVEATNMHICNALTGGSCEYFLYSIEYEIVGCDIQNQTIHVRVTASLSDGENEEELEND